MKNGQKIKWAQENALGIQKRFEQWQQPLGIDGTEYVEYLKNELIEYCDDPLLKEYFESISHE